MLGMFIIKFKMQPLSQVFPTNFQTMVPTVNIAQSAIDTEACRPNF